VYFVINFIISESLHLSSFDVRHGVNSVDDIIFPEDDSARTGDHIHLYLIIIQINFVFLDGSVVTTSSDDAFDSTCFFRHDSFHINVVISDTLIFIQSPHENVVRFFLSLYKLFDRIVIQNLVFWKQVLGEESIFDELFAVNVYHLDFFGLGICRPCAHF